MSIRYIINKAHLYLGLTSGIIVFVLGVTGCLFVFQPELTHWARHDLLYVDVRQPQTLPISQLQKKVARALGVDHLRYGLTTFRDPARNWQAFTYQPAEDGWTYFDSTKDYRTLYINPYTGKVAGIVNEEEDFFQIVKAIHWSLLLSTPIGQPIVAWSTVIFFICLITGLVLWWPKCWNGPGRQKSFRIKWKVSWKRFNYDLHNVVGFYSLVVLLIIAFTGLYWYFPFAQKSLHFLGTGNFSLPNPSMTQAAVARTLDQEPAVSPVQQAYINAWSRFPQMDSITFTAPASKGDAIRAVTQPTEGSYYQRSLLLFDPQTGQLTKQNLYVEKNAGEKLLAMNYDIHVGSIGGFWSKVLAFIASFISASLPVTGFLYWYPGWRRKRRRKQRRLVAEVKRPASRLLGAVSYETNRRLRALPRSAERGRGSKRLPDRIR